MSAEDAEGRGEHLTAFIREVTRRGAKNTILSTEDTEGHGEHLTAFDARSHAENTKGVAGFPCAAAQPVADRSHFASASRCSDKRQRAPDRSCRLKRPRQESWPVFFVLGQPGPGDGPFQVVKAAVPQSVILAI